MKYVSPEEAKSASGLRLSFVADVSSPWGEAVKGMLNVKNIPFTATLYRVGDPNNQALVEWTGADTAPSACMRMKRPALVGRKFSCC